MRGAVGVGERSDSTLTSKHHHKHFRPKKKIHLKRSYLSAQEQCNNPNTAMTQPEIYPARNYIFSTEEKTTQVKHFLLFHHLHLASLILYFHCKFTHEKISLIKNLLQFELFKAFHPV